MKSTRFTAVTMAGLLFTTQAIAGSLCQPPNMIIAGFKYPSPWAEKLAQTERYCFTTDDVLRDADVKSTLPWTRIAVLIGQDYRRKMLSFDDAKDKLQYADQFLKRTTEKYHVIVTELHGSLAISIQTLGWHGGITGYAFDVFYGSKDQRDELTQRFFDYISNTPGVAV